MLEEIYNKTNIDMTAFIKRLEIELSINGIKDEEKKKIASAQLVCSIYDTMIIILGKTHQEKILNELYTTWLRMTKDYWYLNKYDKLFVKNIDINSDENSNLKIKSIQVGDTTTTFAVHPLLNVPPLFIVYLLPSIVSNVPSPTGVLGITFDNSLAASSLATS